jgi:hypothetical protein
MNADELKAAFSNLPDILPRTKWDEHRLSLRRHVKKDDLDEFLTWSTITATMFVGEAPYVEQELLQLMNHRNHWRSALSESDIGNPPRLSYAPWTSGKHFLNPTLAIHPVYPTLPGQAATSSIKPTILNNGWISPKPTFEIYNG